MSELAELFVLLFGLYLFECLAWVPPRTVGFYRWAGRWRARAAFRFNASWPIAVVFGKPWPPLTPPLLAEPLPFAVDPDGITLVEVEGQRRQLAWGELGPLSATGHHLAAGNLRLASVANNSAALALAEGLERLRLDKRREPRLRQFLARRFDLAEPEARTRQLAASVRALRISSNLLWLALFGGLGAAAFTHNLLILLTAGALTLLLWPIESIILARTLRRLTWLPPACRPDFSKRLVAMLSPISGVRSADLLAREVWAGLDPLTVAATLLNQEDLVAFARPRLAAVQERAGDELAWWRAERRRLIEQVLRAKGIAPSAVLAPPEREGSHVATYCPCCQTQYGPGPRPGDPCPSGSCPDIPLRDFAKVENPS